jgi:hypothetical protein
MREERTGVVDYTTADGDEGNTHYNGVPSSYGKRVEEQNRMQPQYCEPGEAGGDMRGEKRNEQEGP